MRKILLYLGALLTLIAAWSCGGDDDTKVNPQIETLHFAKDRYAFSVGETASPEIYVKFRGVEAETAYDRTTNSLNIKWKVADPTVASVSDAGVVTGLKDGITTLTATTSAYKESFTTTLAVEAIQSNDGWVLTSWNGSAELSGKVYISLGEDGAFALYQNIKTPGFTVFKGTYTLSGKELSGKYDDNSSWTQSYDADFGATTLTLTGKSDHIVSVYASTRIPDYVKDGITGTQASRSAADNLPFL